MKDFKEFINENKELIFSTHKALCLIPAPSYFEQKRAEYIKNWLENIGAKGVYIDEALNVIFPLNCENSNEISVFAAHTDTVFPDLEPLPYEEKDGIIVDQKVGGIDCWQMVGISYWDEMDGKKLFNDIKEVFEMPGGKEKYWEQVPLAVCKDKYKVAIKPCMEDDIVEIDTFRELKAIDKSYAV